METVQEPTPDNPHPGMVVMDAQHHPEPNAKSPHKKSSTKLLMGIVFAILAVVVSGYIGYAYTIAPKQALSEFFESQADVEKAKFKGFINVETNSATAQAFGLSGKFDLNFDGAFDGSNDDVLRGYVDMSGEIGASGVNLNLVLKARADAGKAYVNISQPELIESFIPGLLNKWIEFDASDFSDVNGEESCIDEEAAQEKLDEILNDSSLLKSSSRKSLFPVEVDGYRASHFAGEVDMSILIVKLKEVESEFGESCEVGTGFDSEDLDSFKDATVRYEVWNGNNFNKLRLDIKSNDEEKLKVVLEMSIFDTGAEVEVEIPTGSQTFDEILEQSTQFNQFDSSFDGNATGVLGAFDVLGL